MRWEIAKSIGGSLFLVSTLILFSPILAATSTVPWILFLIGNIIWVIDNHRLKNTPWYIVGLIFCVLDILLIYARITRLEILDYIGPVTNLLERML